METQRIQLILNFSIMAAVLILLPMMVFIAGTSLSTLTKQDTQSSAKSKVMMTLVSLLKKKAQNQLRIWSNWKPQEFSEVIQLSRQELLQFVSWRKGTNPSMYLWSLKMYSFLQVAEVHQGKM